MIIYFITIIIFIYFSQYALTIPRPYTIHYNPYTQNMEVIDGNEQVVNMVRTLRSMIYIIG